MDRGASLAEINVVKIGNIKKCETNGISKHVQTRSGVHPALISKKSWVPSWC
jgi:hypothetical protein